LLNSFKPAQRIEQAVPEPHRCETNGRKPHLKGSPEARTGSCHALLLFVNCRPQKEVRYLAFPTGRSLYFTTPAGGKKIFSSTDNKQSSQ